MTRVNYELLSPAGDPERLQAALRYGADAVYLGGPMLQLRADNTGFDMEALACAVRETHAKKRRLYVTVNAFANNREIDAVGDYAQALKALGVDAVIVSDLGVFNRIRHSAPELDIHVSTQANCLNYEAARLYADLGAKRVVLGREMSLDEIADLHRRVPDIELECFVHGAMCMSYSGRCMLSAYLTGRSANRGACTQSCRWQYHLCEEKRPGEYFPIEEDARGTTILSSFDLCCMEFLDQLMAAGVRSFKLEGRMKSPFYVATVTNAYRRRIDDLLVGKNTPAYIAPLMRELNAVSHRPYAGGFYFGEMKRHAPDDGVYLQDTDFVGVVRTVDGARIGVEVRNRIPAGSCVEVLSPEALGRSFIARALTDAEGRSVDCADRPGEIYTMHCDAEVQVNDLLRIRRP